MKRGPGYMEGVEWFGCLIPPKIWRWYEQHMGKHCRDAKEFIQHFCEGFLKWVIILDRTPW